MSSTECSTRADLESLWSSCFTESSVRDAVEELLQVEVLTVPFELLLKLFPKLTFIIQW